MKRSKHGFTLIEMLVVIAIIAVLVSIVVPVIGNNTKKASAAVDAANLRTVLGMVNTVVMDDSTDLPALVANTANPDSKLYPDSELRVLYEAPGFVEVYFVNDGNYYGLDYLSEYAVKGSSAISTAQPTTTGIWYTAGSGLTE